MRLYEWETLRCVPLIRDEQADGEGGQRTEYTEGDAFYASIHPARCALAERAKQEDGLVTYRVTISGQTPLFWPGDCFLAEDGRRFRVVSEGRKSPARSGFAFTQFEAEAWQKEGAA